MSGGFTRFVLNVALLGVSGGVLWFSHASLVSLQAQEYAAVQNVPVTLPALPEAEHDFAYYGVINQQSVFSAERPVFTAVGESIPEIQEAPRTMTTGNVPFTLVGILISGDSKAAVVKSPRLPDVVSLHVGQILDTWVVKEINHNSVLLESGAAQQVLRLDEDKKK